MPRQNKSTNKGKNTDAVDAVDAVGSVLSPGETMVFAEPPMMVSVEMLAVRVVQNVDWDNVIGWQRILYLQDFVLFCLYFLSVLNTNVASFYRVAPLEGC